MVNQNVNISYCSLCLSHKSTIGEEKKQKRVIVKHLRSKSKTEKHQVRSLNVLFCNILIGIRINE